MRPSTKPQQRNLKPHGAPKKLQERPPRVEEALVDVTALGGQGDAVARLPTGEVVLIEGGAPGDRLRVGLKGKRQGVMRAELLEIVTSSPQRTSPPCPVFRTCGGCVWQHVDLARQRLEKWTLVRRALGRDAPEPKLDERVPPWTHRRRARLHLRRQGGRLQAGMMQAGTEALAGTPACPVLVPELERLRLRLGEVLEPWTELGEVYAVLGAEGVTATLHARVRAGAGLPDVTALANALDLVGLRLQLGPHQARFGQTEVTLPETVGDLPILCTAEGFCQGTQAGSQAIREAVVAELEAIGGVAMCQEFFSGSGLLTALLAGRVAQVRTVEWDPDAVDRAARGLQEPLAQRGTRLLALTGDAAELAQLPQENELWLLDPGRPGAREVCERAAEWQPRHLIYVSCAMDTLGRDLKVLLTAGYRVVSATAIDTFPHTAHVEAVVRLQAAG